MSDHPYTRSLVDGFWNVTGANLNPLVVIALPGKKFVSRFSGVDVVVAFVDDLTAPEVVLLDVAVADAKLAFDALPQAKAEKVAAINQKTIELLAQGAQFDNSDGNGVQVYQIDGDAQFEICTIYGLYAIHHPGPAIYFPTTFPTIDATIDTAFADASAIQPFIDQVIETHVFFVSGGKALCVSVNAALTVAAVDAIDDTRTWPMP